MNNYEDFERTLPWYELGMELYDERILQEQEKEYQLTHCWDCNSHIDEPCDIWCSVTKLPTNDEKVDVFQECQELYDVGYAKGYEEGYKLGRNQGCNDMIDDMSS